MKHAKASGKNHTRQFLFQPHHLCKTIVSPKYIIGNIGKFQIFVFLGKNFERFLILTRGGISSNICMHKQPEIAHKTK